MIIFVMIMMIMMIMMIIMNKKMMIMNQGDYKNMKDM